MRTPSLFKDLDHDIPNQASFGPIYRHSLVWSPNLALPLSPLPLTLFCSLSHSLAHQTSLTRPPLAQPHTLSLSRQALFLASTCSVSFTNGAVPCIPHESRTACAASNFPSDSTIWHAWNHSYGFGFQSPIHDGQPPPTIAYSTPPRTQQKNKQL